MNRDLPHLPFLERCAEVLRYQLLRLEHSLSSGGGLRAWLKLNLLIAITLAIPAIFVVPAVSAILAGIADWTASLRDIAQNLLITILYLIAIAAVITTVIWLCSLSRR